MSRKHFIAIAADIKWQTDRFVGDHDTLCVIRALATDLAHTFKSANSNFDKARFMTACGF